MRCLLLWLTAAGALLGQVSSTAYIPQVVDGGGWKTVLTVVNMTWTSAQGTIHFYADDGSPLMLAVPALSSSPVSEVALNLPPRGVAVVETAGNAGGPTLSGWADFEVETPGPMVISALYRQRVSGRPDFETAIASRGVATVNPVYAFDHRGGFTSGFGLINSSRVNELTLQVVVRDENGQALVTDTLTLAPRAHRAFSLGDQYPATLGQRGSVEFVPQTGGWLSVMGLRFNPTGPFTALQQALP